MQLEMLHFGYVFHEFHYPVVGLYHVIGYYVRPDEPPLLRESSLLFVTAFFHNHIGYVFHDCHLPVVGLYHLLNYYVGHDELPLVRDSFPLLGTDFVHVPEHYEVPEQHVIIWGHFSYLWLSYGLCRGCILYITSFDCSSFSILFFFCLLSWAFLSFRCLSLSSGRMGLEGFSTSKHIFISREKNLLLLSIVCIYWQVELNMYRCGRE